MATREEKIAQDSFPVFFFQRAVRIFPFYWVALLVQYALKLWCTGSILNGMGLWSTVSNALLLPWILKNILTMINAPCWYLVVLLLCYWILWLVLYFTVRNGRNPVPLYAILAFCGVLAKMGSAPFDIIPNSICRGMITFFIGCLLFHFGKLFSGRKTAITAFAILIGCAASVLLIPGLRDNTYMIATAILFPALLLLCLNSDWLEGILNHRWVEILSDSSYVVFILNASFLALHHKVFFLNVSDNIRGNVLVMFASTAGLVALSVLCHLYVEKPLTAYFLHVLQKKRLLPTDPEENQDHP